MRESLWRVRQEEPLSETRGVCSFGYNGTTIFVKTDVESVASALNSHRNAIKWQQNVIDQEVTISDQCFFVFRFSGHKWTNIIARDHVVSDWLDSEESAYLAAKDTSRFKQRRKQLGVHELNEGDACWLSEQLKARTIYYGISDCACAVEYRIYERGELLEELSTAEGYEITTWRSTIRDTCEMYIQENVKRWIEDLFRENDLLEVGEMFMYWVGHTLCEKGRVITNRDPDRIIERCDFIALQLF